MFLLPQLCTVTKGSFGAGVCEKKALFMSVVRNWITLRYFIPYCSKEYFVKNVDLAITLVLSHSTVKVWVKSEL